MKRKKSFFKICLNAILNIFNKIKEFVKEKKKALIIIFFSIIIFIILLSILGIKISFMTESELNIKVDPTHKVINTEIGMPVELEFKIENNNFWMCDTECSYELYDPYNREILTQETEAIKSSVLMTKSYEIEPVKTGRGQRLFYFEVACHNIKSTLCQTEEENFYSSSLITINYDYSTNKKMQIRKMMSDLDVFVSETEKANSLTEDINFILNNIEQETTHSINISNEQRAISDNIEKIRLIQALWLNESYDLVTNLFSESDVEKIKNISTQLSTIKIQLLNNIETYNLFLDKIIFLNQLNNKELFIIDNFYRTLNNDGKTNDVNTIRIRIRLLKAEIQKTKIEFAKDLLTTAESIEVDVVMILNQYEQDYHNYLNSLNLEQHKSIQNRYNNLLNEKDNEIVSKLEFLDLNYGDDACESGELILNNYIITRNKANENIIEFLDSNFTCEDDCPQEILNNNSMKILKGFRNSIIYDNYSFEFNSMDNIYIFNNSETIYELDNLSFSNYIEMTKIYESEFNNISNFIMNMCFFITKDNDLTQTILKKYDKINDSFNSNNYVNLNVEFNYPEEKCCIFGSCYNCEKEEQKEHYPLILLHGHNFNKYNPIQSIVNSMSEIQLKLSHDENYINGAETDLLDVNNSEIWSKMQTPIAVRASYYYITYYDFEIYSVSTMNEESIENYAIRLKEIINLVKKRTGAEKVNIVGHSMGGLVARYELFLFGDEDVNKLILIGTPNKGIVGRVEGLCPTFGAKKECDDMNVNSIFLKKLNSAKNIARNTEIFNIYGSGCDTDGEDGDGIVTTENAYLASATNIEINGQCNDFLNLEMHNDLINTDKYPEVYENVVDILIE